MATSDTPKPSMEVDDDDLDDLDGTISLSRQS
jgi:hypothetical protein